MQPVGARRTHRQLVGGGQRRRQAQQALAARQREHIELRMDQVARQLMGEASVPRDPGSSGTTACTMPSSTMATRSAAPRRAPGAHALDHAA